MTDNAKPVKMNKKIRYCIGRDLASSWQNENSKKFGRAMALIFNEGFFCKEIILYAKGKKKETARILALLGLYPLSVIDHYADEFQLPKTYKNYSFEDAHKRLEWLFSLLQETIKEELEKV